jgi:hypothetical protein
MIAQPPWIMKDSRAVDQASNDAKKDSASKRKEHTSDSGSDSEDSDAIRERLDKRQPQKDDRAHRQLEVQGKKNIAMKVHHETTCRRTKPISCILRFH